MIRHKLLKNLVILILTAGCLSLSPAQAADATKAAQKAAQDAVSASSLCQGFDTYAQCIRNENLQAASERRSIIQSTPPGPDRRAQLAQVNANLRSMLQAIAQEQRQRRLDVLHNTQNVNLQKRLANQQALQDLRSGKIDRVTYAKRLSDNAAAARKAIADFGPANKPSAH